MRKYFFSFYFNYEPETAKTIFWEGLKKLGFLPKVMDIYVDNRIGLLSEVNYNEELIDFYFSKTKASLITVKSKMYDDDHAEYYWYSIKISFTYNLFCITWFNSEFEFLTNSSIFDSLIARESFIYASANDSHDVFDESTTNYEYIKLKYPDRLIKTKKDYMGNVIADTSENWGRSIDAGGITFGAFSMMWFGDEFYKIIPKEKLLAYPSSIIRKDNLFERVYIKLFDLYSKPSIEINRKIQKEFWKFFDLKKKIEEYKRKKEKEIGII